MYTHKNKDSYNSEKSVILLFIQFITPLNFCNPQVLAFWDKIVPMRGESESTEINTIPFTKDLILKLQRRA